MKTKENKMKKIDLSDVLRISVGKVNEAEAIARFINGKYGHKASRNFMFGFRYARNKLQETKNELLKKYDGFNQTNKN